jgi:hypothetical protein
MRGWWILAGWLMAAPMAHAACGEAAIVRDWGLHRAWRVQRDCARPERPAALVEVPWTTTGGKEGSERKTEEVVRAMAPAVLGGMRVRAIRHETNAEVQLTGTALNTAQLGERVAVRAGWSGTIVPAIVRGPGLVELQSERGKE